MQVTFENSQFQQAIEMREKGIAIPDATVIRYSNLTDKHEILGQMQGAGAPPPDPKAEAEVGLKAAQAQKTQAETEKVRAETVEVRGRTMYSAMQSAQVVAAVPQTAEVADQLLGSQGFEDQDQGPAVAAMTGGLPERPAPEGLIPENTDPLTPTSPAVGFEAGIETPEADGVVA